MAESTSGAGFDLGQHLKLYGAVVDGNTTKVQSLLLKYPKDEARDVLNRYNIGSVPFLIVAIRNRHENLVQLLVDHYDVRVDQTDIMPPKDIDKSAIEEWTPVLEGVVVRNPVILDILCKKAKNLDIGFPVHQACRTATQEGTDILNILLRHGAQINIRNKIGITPLIVACQYLNYHLVNFLLQNGADVNICSLEGNTPLHHLIERVDDRKTPEVKKKSPDYQNLPLQLEARLKSYCDHRHSAEQTILNISTELLERGMLQKPNEIGITPLYLACLKGSESIVEFLLDSLSVNNTERANCYELLASSMLFNNCLFLTFGFKKNLDEPYHFLNKAMILRHSHDPPLSKCRKQVNMESVLHQKETQTLEEIATIKANINGLITHLLFARQKILGVEVYNDYLLQYIGEYIHHNINFNDHLYTVVLLLNAFRLQRQSSVNPKL